MSILNAESHPAFYHSKKRIWNFPITAPPSNSDKPSWQAQLNAYFIGGFDSLWKLWYAMFVVLSTCLLSWMAIVRYQEFKAQSLHPRFGLDWNWSFPLNLQVACLVVVVSLFPLLTYATVSRVGHSANDGITLGKDCLHLQAMLIQLPRFRLARRSADPEALERLRARIACSTQSLNDAALPPDFESFIIQDKPEAHDNASWCVATRRQLRPFACLIHVFIAFALLMPVCIFEAEQIKNEATPPEYACHSNLDWLLNGFRGTPEIGTACLNASSTSLDEINFLSGRANNHSQFNGHPYPSIPAEISPEFILLTITLVLLTVRYAEPFWFTNRPFSTLLSFYTAITGCYILLEVAAMELLVKLYTAGTRDQFGKRIDIIPSDRQLVNTWVCIITSAVGFFTLLAGLMAFYAFGELLFQRSVINYVNLIMAGEFDQTKQQNIISKEENASTPIDNGFAGGCDFGGPSVIAVTTKAWRPVRRNSLATANALSRATTPSALSASNDTLRSKTASTLGIQPNIIGKSNNIKSSIAFWPSIISAISFGLLTLTRSCLIGPMVQCYWHAQVKLPLVYVAFSAFYLILWLVLWFGVAVKTAWRFRLLHMPAPPSRRSQFASPRHQSYAERLGRGVSQFAPWPLVNYPAATQLGANYFWPWPSYQNGLAPTRNGSLAFGNSPTLCDGNYAEREPTGLASMYGCFTDPQNGNPGGFIRGGPPTLSDESDNAMQMEYDRQANYAYLQKRAGLVTICDDDGASEESYQQYKKDATDPAYVSLALLGRTGSPQRSSQGGSRKGVYGARVTFKSDDGGDTVEGNFTSSDSGVCTNGSGSRIVGKLNFSNHPLFVGANGHTSSPQGFIPPSASHATNVPVRLESDERLCSQV